MKKIRDIFNAKKEKGEKVFSYELFPPRTEKGMNNLMKTVEGLQDMNPDYISVTYGAGGSSSKATLKIASAVQNTFDIPCMHHLTLVNQKRSDLVDIIKGIVDEGIVNILALRGDPPESMGGEFRRIDKGLEYAYELIDLVRKTAGDSVSIGVAGFPETHVLCQSEEEDTRYAKLKIEHDADFIVTQLFFDNSFYSAYVKRLSDVQVNVPVIPGVLPITSYTRLLDFCKTCGANVTENVHQRFKPIADDTDAVSRAGIDFATTQCRDLLDRGSPAIHFYCLNKIEPVRTIWKKIK